MNTGTAIVGVALIGTAGFLAYYIYKKNASSLTVGGLTLGSATTNALANAGVSTVSSLGTSLGNALAGTVSGLFNGGSADNTDSEDAYG